MTTEAMDLLDRLSNPTLAKKAELDSNRPMDRSPLRHFKADILGSGADLQIEQRRVGNFDQQGIWLELNVTEVYEASPWVEPGEHKIWIRTPSPRRDGKPQQPNINSELVQTTMAAGVESIRQLPGRKGVVFKEDTHQYEGRQDTGEPDPKNPARTLWKDATFTTFFYRIDLSGSSASSNGATAAPAAEVTPEVKELALGIIREAGEAGIPEKDFNLAASKVALLKPLWGQIADGKFIAAQLKDKTVSTTAEGNLVAV